MSMNYLLFYNKVKFSEFKVKRDAKLKATLKKPYIFNILISYLDDETMFESNYVCKLFTKMIENQKDLHYKLLIIQKNKHTNKKKNQKEIFESAEKSRKVSKENNSILTIFWKGTIPQYNKLKKEKLTDKSKEKKCEENINVDKQELEEFLSTLQKISEEAEMRKKREEELSSASKLFQKDTLNGYTFYQPIQDAHSNILMNAFYNIAMESETFKLFQFMYYDEIYQGLGKIIHKVDEKMFDFDYKVTEYIVKIKYKLKKKELPFKSLYKEIKQ